MPKSRTRKQSKRTGRSSNKQSVPRKSASSSSRSGFGSSIVRAGAGLSDKFLPGSGGIVRGLGKIFGFGAYTRAGAESYLASQVPSMHATLDHGVRIAHHEYLGEMSSTIAYAIRSYPINPGMASTFPWLSSVAAAFQKWEDHGVIFYFKSTSSNALNSTNTALGSVMGAVTYNPYQVAPSDKVTMLGLSGVQTGKPADDNVFPVECKMSQSLFGTKLIRTVVVTDDLAKYDAGNFHLATVGSQAAATIGELHVVYDITLKEPKLSQVGWATKYVGTHTNSLAMVAATAASTSNPLGLTITNPTATTCNINFPSHSGSMGAAYIIRCRWQGGTTAAVVYPARTFNNLTRMTVYGGVAYQDTPATGTNCGQCEVVECVKITNRSDPASLVLTGGGGTLLPSTDPASLIEVTEIDSTYL